MNIKKIIQEELGTELEKYGFKYRKYESYCWPYEREINGIRQEIMVARDRFEKGYIKVMFFTNAYGQTIKEFKNFVPEEGARHWDYWGYENEEELREILREFKRLILTYGLDFLEEISKPTTDAIPTKEANEYLYGNHQAIFEEYRIKFGTVNKTPEEVIDLIYQKLDEKLDEPFNELEDIFIGLAALYGHTICWGDKGIWTWDQLEDACYIENILGSCKKLPPLNLIIAVWDMKRKDRKYKNSLLRTHYETALIYYYRDHPEEIEDDE